MDTTTITNYGEEKFRNMQDELDLFDEMGIMPVKKLQGKLNAIENALVDIKQNVKQTGFFDEQDEISFFKTCKPKFIAAQIKAIELFKIEADKPVADDTEIKSYYEQELFFIKKFLNKHQFFYQYYLLGGNELDQIYFTREPKTKSAVIREPSDQDSSFATAGDHLFGRFLAYEQLQQHLVNILYNPKGNSDFGDRTLPDLKWTGDKANLVELAYGIWLTSQINGGQATLTQIVRWMENTLDISLGNIQKHFGKIKSRKRLSTTKYLDIMREEMEKKIMEDYA